jgi:hypothetical protein
LNEAICDGNGLAVFELLRHGSRRKTDAILFAFDLVELAQQHAGHADSRPMPRRWCVMPHPTLEKILPSTALLQGASPHRRGGSQAD